MEPLSIAGKKIEVLPLSQGDRSGMWLELMANFEIGKFEFNRQRMFLFIPKAEVEYTPVQLKKLSERIEKAKQIPAVFFYHRLLTYERDRLIEQGVYFVVSNKYAFIPSLVINRKEDSQAIKNKLYPSTQYILLYHLQVQSIEGKRIKELEGILPYKYAAIARGVSQLRQLGLIEVAGGKEKTIVVNMQHKELWEKAQPYLVNPIKAIYFSAMPLSEGKVGNVSALSHYSMLASEDVPTKAITSGEFAELKLNGYPFLPFEDVQRIEVWKYPPLGNSGYVDKLSLFLTLKEDTDPRVEKELETMINEMTW